MDASAILRPVVAMGLWTLVMALWMFFTRIPAMQRARIDPQRAQDTSKLSDLLPPEIMRVSNNYNHLFEQPVLFYALALVIAVEGTRSRSEYWKSGFYRIAEGAKVPIVPTVLDFGRRRVAIGEGFHPSGSTRADMDRLREFYAGSVGLYPDNTGPVRLEEES